MRKHGLHMFWKDVLEVDEFLDLTQEKNFIEPCPKKTKKEEEEGEGKKTGEGSKSDDTKKIEAKPIEKANSVKTVKIDVSCSSESNAEMKLPEVNKDEVMEVDSKTPDTKMEVEEVNSTPFSTNDLNSLNKRNSEVSSDLVNSVTTVRGVQLEEDPADAELFCLKRNLGTQEYVGQRVLQVATILRNLSFIEDNIPILVKSRTFLRFMLLCASSQWNQLKNLGLDMLGNMATEFLVKDLQSDRLAVCLLQIISRGLQSEDRNCCISSLEILNKLSQNELNEDVLLKNLEASVYERVCSFLTIHDVMLLIYTLECLYSLSSLGERACNLIVNNHGVIDTLVSLVTVEGKSYGPKACIGMKLVETVTGNITSSVGGVSNAPSVGTSVSTSLTTIATSSAVTSTTVSSSQPTPVKATLPSTPQRPVQIVPQRLIAVSPAPVVTRMS